MNSGNIMNSEQGFVIVTSLLLLAVLSIIGVAAVNTSIFELQLTGNETAYNKAFYEADGGADVGTEVLEQNIACVKGFTPNQTDGGSLLDNTIYVPFASLKMSKNKGDIQTPTDDDSGRDFYFPFNYGNNIHTNLTVTSDTKLLAGAAQQMAAGYEGKGKSAAKGGVGHYFDLRARHIGTGRSGASATQRANALVQVEWLHVVGQSGDCKY